MSIKKVMMLVNIQTEGLMSMEILGRGWRHREQDISVVGQRTPQPEALELTRLVVFKLLLKFNQACKITGTAVPTLILKKREIKHKHIWDTLNF